MNSNLDNQIKELLASADLPNASPPSGHEKRFLDKLNQQQKKPKRVYWKYVSIAASLLLLVTFGWSFWNQNHQQNTGLAGISDEMKQTEAYFTATIEKELQLVQGKISPETQKIIEDGLYQIQVLEVDYQQLEEDLVKSGNDQRVIYAMINNFQTRIEILETILQQTEAIKNLKPIPHENTI